MSLLNIFKIKSILQNLKERELFVSAAWFGLGKLIPGGVNFLSVVFFVRYFGSELYGMYSLEMSFTLSVCSFASGWLNQAQLRRFKFEDKTTQASTLLFCTVISILFASVIGIIYKIFFMTHESHASNFTSFFIFSSILLYNSIYYELIASFKAKTASFFEIFRSLVFFILPLLLGLYFKNLMTILYGVIASYLIAGCYGYFGLKDIINYRKIDYTLVKKIFSFGWPFSLLLFLNELSRYVERNVLLTNTGAADLGHYVALSEMVLRSYSLLFVPFTLAIHPKYMHYHDTGDKIKAIKTLHTGIKFQFFIFILLFTFLYFFGSPLLSLLLKSKETIPTSLILLLALAGFVWQQASLWQKPLEAGKKSFIMLIFYFIGFCFQVFILKKFTSSIGIYAAPTALLTSGIIYIILIKIFSFLKQVKK